jgi:hypothetical protein
VQRIEQGDPVLAGDTASPSRVNDLARNLTAAAAIAGISPGKQPQSLSV